MRILIIATAAAALSGCVGPLIVDHVRADAASAQAAQSVQVYTPAQLQGRKFQLVQPLSAVSCKNKTGETSPSSEEAILQLKIKATLVLANGLTNVYCEDPRGVNLANNCWASVKCHAAAITVTEP